MQLDSSNVIACFQQAAVHHARSEDTDHVETRKALLQQALEGMERCLMVIWPPPPDGVIRVYEDAVIQYLECIQNQMH